MRVGAFGGVPSSGTYGGARFRFMCGEKDSVGGLRQNA